MARLSRPACIYVAGTFSHENKGDAALLESFRALVAQTLPDVRLTFATTRPDLAASLPVEHAEPLPLDPHGLWSRGAHRFGRAIHRDAAGWLVAAQVAAFDATWRLPRRLGAIARRRRSAIERADLVAFLPGGYLMAPETDADLWLYHASAIIEASRLGRPIALFPGSYGPFVGIHRAMARRILDRCDTIMVREQYSLDVLAALGLHRPAIHLVPDAAFAFRDDGRGAASIDALLDRLNPGRRPLVVISAKPHHFPNLDQPQLRWAAYISALAESARRIVDDFGAAVILAPQSVGSAGEDRDAGRAVAALAGAGVEPIDTELSPYELSALYQRAELVIGTRMHANILAMAVGTPVVAVAYEHKTPGIMRMAGLQQFVISIDTINGVDLHRLVAFAWQARSTTRAHLEERVPALVTALSRSAADVLAPLAAQ